MAGINYTDKNLLITEVINEIKTNSNNETTSQKLQNQFLNVIESLWDREILESFTCYVNKSGNDSTGILGSKIKKFKTINGANEAIREFHYNYGSYSFKVFVESSYSPTTYSESNIFFGENIYIIERGVEIESYGNLFYEENGYPAGFYGEIRGEGIFINKNENSSLIQVDGSVFLFEFSEIIQEVNYNSTNKSLLGTSSGSQITFRGNSNNLNQVKSNIQVSHSGVLINELGQNNYIIFENLSISQNSNNSTIFSFYTFNNSVFLINCKVSSAGENSNIFGNFSHTSGIKFILKNTVLISNASTCSTESNVTRPYSYVIMDNNCLSNKPLSSSTRVLVGVLNVNLNYELL